MPASAGSLAEDGRNPGDQLRLPGIRNDGRFGDPAATAASCLAIHRCASASLGKFVTTVGDLSGIETSISKAPSVRAISL